MVARAAAYADIDGDGDLDVLVTENAGPAHLWRNDLDGARRFVRVDVEGRASNRDGLDARLELVAGARRQVRRVRTGGGFLAAFEKPVTFGLGDAARADTLLIRWPSGHIDLLAGIEAGRRLRIVEGMGDAPAP